MNKEQAWLWLTNVKGIGNKKIKQLLGYFDSPMDIYNAEEIEFRMIMELNDKDITTILKAREEFDVRKFEEYLHENEIKYISIQDKKYPKMLKNIDNPPHLIYYKGSLPDKEDVLLGMVGARNCTEYGRKVAYNLSMELAQNDVTIVSGMAIGIDTYAHKGALDGKGKTIAVLGCGIDICYPKSNKELMKGIIKNGAVISEYPPKVEPLPQLFPARNRIISGMSSGIIVVEATQNSGSLITVSEAKEQGRKVFAVPGSIYNSLSEGTNIAIREGALLVTSTNDILNEVKITRKKLINMPKAEQDKVNIKIPQYIAEKNNFYKSLDEDEKIVYSCIDSGGSHIDDIYLKSKFDISKLQHVITMLEINGIVRQLPGKIFERLM